MKKQKKYWYVVKSDSGFTTLIPAATSKEARGYYSEIYYGKAVSAYRYRY